MIKYRVLLLSIGVLLLSIVPVQAVEWTITRPWGLGYTNIIGDQFTISQNIDTTGGSTGTYDMLSTGAYTTTTIFSNCDNCTDTMINPVDNSRWGVDEAGNIFYTNNINTVDYSAGFYTAGVTGTCYSAGGNCNPLYKADVLSTPTSSRKIAFDSEGNVYTASGYSIKKYVKSLGYDSQTFYTLVSGVDYTPASGAVGQPTEVFDIQVDNQNRLHILTGSRKGAGFAGTAYLGKTVIDSTGTHVSANKTLNLTLGGLPASGYRNGGLILDTTNPEQNFTFAFEYFLSSDTELYLWHNSSAGVPVDIAGGDIVTQDNITDIAYNNYKIYVSFGIHNLIRTYVTNYEGYGYTQVPTNPDGITGTFTWLSAYGASATRIAPGEGLRFRYTVSDVNLNYTYWIGWGFDSTTAPDGMNELQNAGQVSGQTLSFTSRSNELAGSSIYGYVLTQRTNDSSWYLLNTPTKLDIDPADEGYDSIILDKTEYNNTGLDTLIATFTYKGGVGVNYLWTICQSIDCREGSSFKVLLPTKQSSDTTLVYFPEGQYYAILMKGYGLPGIGQLFQTVAASQYFEVRPPDISARWEHTTYNQLPPDVRSTCLDTTDTSNNFVVVNGYAGLAKGFLSCQLIPASAEANNSIMKATLYTKYGATILLNNSFGNIYTANLTANTSGVLIYVLTNSSTTGMWNIFAYEGDNSSSSNTKVTSPSLLTTKINILESKAWAGDTLHITYTLPIYTTSAVMTLTDSAGNPLVYIDDPEQLKAGSTTFLIETQIPYQYGTWTATLDASPFGSSSDAVKVLNGSRPTTPCAPPDCAIGTDQGEQQALAIVNLLSSNIFWALIFTVAMMAMVAFATNQRKGE